MSVKRKKICGSAFDPVRETIEEVVSRSVAEANVDRDAAVPSASQRQTSAPARREVNGNSSTTLNSSIEETPPTPHGPSIDFSVNGSSTSKSRTKNLPAKIANFPASAKHPTTSADSTFSSGSFLTQHRKTSSVSGAVHSLTNGTGANKVSTVKNGKKKPSSLPSMPKPSVTISFQSATTKRTLKRPKVPSEHLSSSNSSVQQQQKQLQQTAPSTKPPTDKLSGLLAQRKKRTYEETLLLDSPPRRASKKISPRPRPTSIPHRLEKMMRKKEGASPWSWKGKPFTRMLYSPEEKRNVERVCYHAIKHKDGEVIKIGDCVLLRAAKGQQKPHIGKIACFWDSERGDMMMTIFWFWRPEEVPEKFRLQHGEMEVFVSSLRDDNFVSCIEEKCFVLTLHQYARYMAASKDYDTVYHRPLEMFVPKIETSINYKETLPDSNIDEQIVYFTNLGFEGKTNRFWRYYFRANRLRKYYLD